MPHENIITTSAVPIYQSLETPPIPQAKRMCTNMPAFLLGRARASHVQSNLTIVATLGVAEIFNGWNMPGPIDADDVMPHIEGIERGIAAMTTLKMHANAMHHVEYKKALGAYRLAANAYHMGTLSAEDLSEMGRGLSEADRRKELLSILFVGVG